MKSDSVDAPHAMEMATKALRPYKEDCKTREEAVKQLLEDLMFYCEKHDIMFNQTLRDAKENFNYDRRLSSVNPKPKVKRTK